MMPQSETELDDLLSTPTQGVLDAMRLVEGDFMLLGVGGKMGPTLGRMLVRASEEAGVRRQVIGVSRFSNPGLEQELRDHGLKTVRADLLNEDAVEGLPQVRNIIYMPAFKFGATGNEPLTWAVNTWLPSVVCQRFRESRILAFSTGNVYGMTPVAGGGSRESDVPAPVGEYAMSCLGRERMFQHFSEKFGIPTVLIRLNYACELRYGVLVDIASKIAAGQPVDLSMGFFNTLWQGDANAMTACALAEMTSPANIVNITGPETLSIRSVAERFGRLLEQPVTFTGQEGNAALLSNASPAIERYGEPRVSIHELMKWIANWIQHGGSSLGKPTRFESLSGQY